MMKRKKSKKKSMIIRVNKGQFNQKEYKMLKRF